MPVGPCSLGRALKLLLTCRSEEERLGGSLGSDVAVLLRLEVTSAASCSLVAWRQQGKCCWEDAEAVGNQPEEGLAPGRCFGV